jgi:hypothetical protein
VDGLGDERREQVLDLVAGQPRAVGGIIETPEVKVFAATRRSRC